MSDSEDKEKKVEPPEMAGNAQSTSQPTTTGIQHTTLYTAKGAVSVIIMFIAVQKTLQLASYIANSMHNYWAN